MDPARFVFLDETGTATNMARRYGRGPLGERLVAAVPHGHWRTTTFITGAQAERHHCSPGAGRAAHRGRFRAYGEQFLAPARAPGDVVVLDNLAAHKIAGIRQALAAAGGAILDLPPYSPDLNPIEQLREAAAPTKEELWSTIGGLLAAVPPSECANYLNHCRYGST
jgi:transposase